MLTSDVNCLFTPRSEENNGKKTEIIDQPRFHADTHSTSQKCPLISSLTPLFDSTNYLALFRSYQRAMIHCQTFSVARGERNAHFSVLAPRLWIRPRAGGWCDCSGGSTGGGPRGPAPPLIIFWRPGPLLISGSGLPAPHFSEGLDLPLDRYHICLSFLK